MATKVSSRRFLVYREDEFGSDPNAKPLGGFKTYADAQKFVDSLSFPAIIHFFWQGNANAPTRKKQDFEYVTDSGTELIFKWEKTEYRVYKKNGQDLKLGATVPEGLMKYCNEKF